jgi:RND superfamily putative drug exporter
MFDHLGKFVTRYWAWVLALWVITVALLKVSAPPWASISQDDDVRSFPSHYDSVVALDLRRKAFPQDAFNSEVVVVVERNDSELSSLDFDFVDALAARLTRVQHEGERRDANDNLVEDKYGLHEFVTHRSSKKGQLLVSNDKKATLLYAGCDHTFMAEKVMKTVQALRDEIKAMRDGGSIPEGIEVAVTGSSGVGADLQFSTNESLSRSFRTTIALVIVILLLVYRSPIVAMNPLATIGVSVVTSMSLMALLTLVNWGGFRFQVLKITEIFVIVVLFGAGTDYCLFLIARYREELEHGAERKEALQSAIRHVGGALAASAATVIVGLGMMIFAEFGKFRYTGPAVAVSLAVALIGALTLTPAMLCLVGKIAFWPFSVRRVERSENEDDSEDGAQPLDKRFWNALSWGIARRPAIIWTVSVLFMLPFAIWGWRLIPTYDFLAELGDTTESKVGSALIRNDGHFPKGTLGRLTILFQSPESNPKDYRTPEVRKDIAELTRRLTQGKSGQMSYYSPDSVAQVLSLTSPLGKAIPVTFELAQAEAPKTPDQKPEAGPEQKPEPTPDKEPAAKTPTKKPGGLSGILKGVTKGVTKAIKDASEASGVGEVARQKFDQGWKDSADHYVSTAVDGKVTRVEVVFNVDPFSRESMQLRDQIDHLVHDFTAEPNTSLAGASHTFAGITSTTYDLEKITQSDQKKINVLVVIAVYAILVVLLRQPGVCIYLMITVLFGYYATLGMTEGFFWMLHSIQHPDLPWLGLDWKVSFFLFIILVAVGEDYNILLMSRVVEEQRKRGAAEGIRVAVARTGGIITSCGVIMAGTFGSMATGTLAAVKELGFALALGVLLDTFVVRPILVPAFLLMLHKAFGRGGGKTSLPAPHSGSRPARAPEPARIATAERRGLIALIAAWITRGM